MIESLNGKDHPPRKTRMRIKGTMTEFKEPRVITQCFLMLLKTLLDNPDKELSGQELSNIIYPGHADADQRTMNAISTSVYRWLKILTALAYVDRKPNPTPDDRQARLGRPSWVYKINPAGKSYALRVLASVADNTRNVVKPSSWRDQPGLTADNFRAGLEVIETARELVMLWDKHVKPNTIDALRSRTLEGMGNELRDAVYRYDPNTKPRPRKR